MLIALLLLVSSSSAALAGPPETWTAVDSGVISNLNEVIYAKNTYVTVGDDGTILTSSEGRTWVKRQSGTTADLMAIAYGNGRFVAVGGERIDGNSTLKSNKNAPLCRMQDRSGNGSVTGQLFVANYSHYDQVGSAGAIITSTDGITWEKPDLSPIDTVIRLEDNKSVTEVVTAGLQEIVFGNGRFIAFGGGLYWSSNGIQWYKHGCPECKIDTATYRGSINFYPRNAGYAAAVVDRAAYGGGSFAALANQMVLTCQEGTEVRWVKPTITGNFSSFNNCNIHYCITYAKGKFVALGPKTVPLISTNGSNWNTDFGGNLPSGNDWMPAPAQSPPCADVTGNDICFAACGESGRVAYSDDGYNWKDVVSATGNNLYGIAAAQNRFVAVGKNGTILISNSTAEVVGAPSQLTAVAVNGSTVKLTWQDNAADENGFIIERREGLGGFIEIATTDANVTSYTDTALSADRTYTYRIFAKGNAASFDPSNESEIKLQGNTASQSSKGVHMCFQVGSTDCTIDGNAQIMDTAPQVQTGRTMLPVRFVATPLGANIAWDSAEKKTTIQMDGKTIELWQGKNTAIVNKVPTVIDPANSQVQPYVVPPGRTMLPLRFIAENLGCDVVWDPKTKQITVTYPKPSI